MSTPRSARPWLGWPALMVLGLGALVAGHWYVYHGGDRELARWIYQRGRFVLMIATLITGLLGASLSMVRGRFGGAWHFAGVVLMLAVVFGAPIPFAYPSSRESQPVTPPLSLPVQGTWRVLAAGHGGSNPLVLEPQRCWGVLLAREEAGLRFRPGALDQVDSTGSFTFGSPVEAPAAGEVVRAVDGEADRSFQTREEGATPLGNHIVLRLEGGEFLFLSHLQQGSALVREGDRVTRGQALARVGSSGRGAPLTEPHLALYVSTSPEPGKGEGVPFTFDRYLSGGAVVTDRLPTGGMGGDGRVLGELIEADGGSPGPGSGE
ncbi:MAG: M23 family metallopeptidase [Planctomycetota bacterium]